MKAIINGRFIIPDETGCFTVEEGLALFFDEKIRAIRPAATVSAAERDQDSETATRPEYGLKLNAARRLDESAMTRRPSAKCSCSRQRQA